MTLRFTPVADGVLRVRLSQEHGETLTERYGLITVPAEIADCGIAFDETGFTLPNGRRLTFSYITSDSKEYSALYDSLQAEFAGKYTDYQHVEGQLNDTKDENASSLASADTSAAGAFFLSIEDGERFYGLGEGANDRVQLRGRAYQNWARYQYNEIPIPLAVSNQGWGVFLNARSRSFTDIGGRYADKLFFLTQEDELDFFILWGGDYAGVLKRYTLLTGSPMLLPRWAYGLTYVAPMYADQETVLAHAERFRQEHIPLDHISLEPGWMDKIYDYSLQKKWCIERFHVPTWFERPNCNDHFISALHRYGFKLSLWLCIRYDLTGEAERTVNPALTDTGECWYNHLKRFVNTGVDGFKLDPADTITCFDKMRRPPNYNGRNFTEMHNVNQVLLPKQMYEGFSAQTNKRPMHHYSGGYMGIQHWSASTTGDNGGELGAMIWLETLAMTGHMNTTVDMCIYHPESIHFGMFVPWAHLNAWSGTRQPWWAGEKFHRMFTAYARIRYRLLPYYYSAALEGHEDSMPIIRPMPLAFPDCKETADETREFMVGQNLLLTAYTDRVTLPEGKWIDAWTGEEHEGNTSFAYTPPENRGGGLFIRGGAILPVSRDCDYSTQYNSSRITLDIYPYGESSYIFREDDGETLDYIDRTSCHTEITCREEEDCITVTIGKRIGDYMGKPDKRTWLVRIHGADGRKLSVTCDPADRVFFCDTRENPFDTQYKIYMKHILSPSDHPFGR